MKIDTEQQISKDICAYLKEQRIKKEVSQRRLAEMTGLSASGIRHIESMNTEPTLYSLLKICNSLEISLPDIIAKVVDNS